MKPKIVLFFPVPQDLIDELGSHFEVTVFQSVDDSNRAEFLNAALVADGLIGMGLPVKTSQTEGSQEPEGDRNGLRWLRCLRRSRVDRAKSSADEPLRSPYGDDRRHGVRPT